MLIVSTSAPNVSLGAVLVVKVAATSEFVINNFSIWSLELRSLTNFLVEHTRRDIDKPC